MSLFSWFTAGRKEIKGIPQAVLQAQQPQQRYLKYAVNSALPEFASGKNQYLASVYLLFVMEHAEQYQKEAAECLDRRLSSMDAVQVMRLGEQFRRTTSMEWEADWVKADIARSRFSFLSGSEYGAVLKIGTFHSNGYFRQRCMERLAEYGDGILLYLVERLNDWVEPIRELSKSLTEEYLKHCDITEILEALPCLEKIKRSGRREQAVVEGLDALVRERILADRSRISPELAGGYGRGVRNALYRELCGQRLLELDGMERLLSHEKDGYGKGVLLRGIFENFMWDEIHVEQYLADPCAIVRKMALEYRYQRQQDAWDGLEAMLLDKSRRIRLDAAYILRKHREFPVLDFYVDRLGQGLSAEVVLGIGDFGSKKEAGLVKPFLKHRSEKIAGAAMTSLGALAGDEEDGLYWSHLFDTRAGVAKRAYQNIQKLGIHYGAGRLYEAFACQENPVIRRYLVRLLLKENSWERLPYLLQLYCFEDADLQEQVRRKVEERGMHGVKISREQERRIREILGQVGDQMPEQVKQGILFDLKYVGAK